MAGAGWGEIGLSDEWERDPREELATLIGQHEVALYRYLVAFTGDREVALDCLQDTFTRAYEQLQRGKSVNTQWLYKVGRNRGIDEFRRRKREGVQQDALETLQAEPIPEEMVSLQHAFRRLSADDRAVLSLAVIEGLSRFFLAPALPPYQNVHYRLLDPDRAARESGYAVAFLETPPTDTAASVGVDIWPYVGWPKHPSGPQPTDPKLRGLGVAIRSLVRYQGGGHTVIVLLNEPSPTAIQTRELILGEHTVHLPGGQEAWASADQSSALPFIHPRPITIPYAHPYLGTVNTLAWVEGHYVVSLWSDLPEGRLRQLAATTTVVLPNPLPSQRHIPSTWPTPLPLDRLPARLQAIVTGGATYQQHGAKLTVSYLFNFASYSQGALYGLDKWHNVSVTVVFPAALQRHTRDPVPHQTVAGGTFGTGGDSTFQVAGMASGTLARALRQGITVRLAWTEHQQRRRQTFHFPLTPQ